MKNLLFTLFTFTSFLMYSQKTEIKTIDNKTIKSIIIKGDAIFKIKTKTTKTNIITIISKIEGEEAQNTTIINEIKNDTLLISSAYKTFLEKNNDKLSAHKQLSIEVSIEIPEPVDGIEIKNDKIEVVFLPLLAFDQNGNRVGYGKERFKSRPSGKSRSIFKNPKTFITGTQIIVPHFGLLIPFAIICLTISTPLISSP